MRIALVTLLLVLAPTSAHANDSVGYTFIPNDTPMVEHYQYEDPNTWHRPTFELAGTIGSRTGELGPFAIDGRQIGLSLARRKHDLTTELAYDLGLVRGDVAGVSHGLSLRHRHSLATVGGSEYASRRGDGWIEGGLGAELLDWRGSGHALGPTLSLGIGADVDFAKDTDDGMDYVGVRFAARVVGGLAPGAEQMRALCVGCETTRADRVDLSIIVSASVVIAP